MGSEEITVLLHEVAAELPDGGGQRTLIIAGGALLAMRGLRDATRDVDSVVRLDDAVRAAATCVAKRHDLALTWLNDSAAAFLPATFDPGECDVLLDHPSLLVLGVPSDQLFLMKLNASRSVDTADMEAIWPSCTFGSPEAAAEAFYLAYPFERRDEFLADQIRRTVE